MESVKCPACSGERWFWAMSAGGDCRQYECRLCGGDGELSPSDATLGIFTDARPAVRLADEIGKARAYLVAVKRPHMHNRWRPEDPGERKRSLMFARRAHDRLVGAALALGWMVPGEAPDAMHDRWWNA